MPKVGKLSKEKSKASKQPKLTDYRVRGETQKANEDMAEEVASREGELGGVKEDAILAAISSMKTEFSLRFDGIMAAIEDMRKEISNCTERVSQAELRISSAEDDVVSLQAKVHTLESKNKTLEDRLGNQISIEQPETSKPAGGCRRTGSMFLFEKMDS